MLILAEEHSVCGRLMRIRLSLTTKILLLIAVPLSFELGLVALLANLHAQAEADAQEAVKARQISDAVNKITGSMFSTWGTVTSNRRRWLDKGFLDSRYKQMFPKIRKEHAQLAALTADRPDLRPLIEGSLAGLKEAEAILDRAVEDLKTGRLTEVSSDYPAKTERLRELFKQLISQELTLAANHEKALADSSPARQSAFRKKILEISFLVVALNIIFSTVLAFYLVKEIISRLSNVTQNAKKFAAGEPLSAPLAGDDEIAELDVAFRKMANDVEELANHRQEMVNMLTHDLRSPLTTLQGFFDLMDAGAFGEVNNEGQRFAKLAERNCSRMMFLINDLLDIEKVKTGLLTLDLELVSVSKIFSDVKDGTKEWIEQHGIKLEIQDSELMVQADVERIERVLFNLVSNAIRYSPSGGTIGLDAIKRFDAVEITVSDEGPGIPSNMLTTIFERFQQVKDTDRHNDKGSGLGLSICNSLVQLHGGKIWVTSEIGKGSTFHFTLPEQGNPLLPIEAADKIVDF